MCVWTLNFRGKRQINSRLIASSRQTNKRARGRPPATNQVPMGLGFTQAFTKHQPELPPRIKISSPGEKCEPSSFWIHENRTEFK